MSKAFLPEDAAVPEAPLVRPRPGKAQAITPGGHRRLVDEHAAAVAAGDAARLAAVDRVLATVEIVSPRLVDGGAAFGCVIDVEDDTGATHTYQLVGPDEIDAAAGRISADSPVGRALLGARPGDSIVLPRGGRRGEVTVRAVRLPEPDASR